MSDEVFFRRVLCGERLNAFWRLGGSFLLLVAVIAAPVWAQEAAKRPVRLLCPSPAGGPSDFAARLIATRLGEALGQNIVVDNRQSVNGIVATEMAAKSPPDGTTLVINVGLYKKLPYDPQRDFAPVSRLVSAGTALVAYPKFAPKTFKEFVAAAKKEPGKINVAVAGANGQVATEVLRFEAGIRLNNVPYKGSSPSEVAVMSGEVEVALLSIPVVAPQVRAGRMKIYGVTTAQRSSLLPEVPTIQEQGLAGYEFGNWHGLLAPKGTPERLVRRLHQEVVRILESRENREIVAARGNEIIAGSPEEFAARLQRDIPKYRKIMADAGIEPQ